MFDPHYDVIESCFRLKISKYFKMCVFKLSANFFENSTSNGQYFNFFIKYWISRCWTPSPLWRHTIAVFSSKVQNMLKYMCLNFLPNFVKTGRKMADFWEIFHKISNFQMFDPLLWRHRGLKIIENFKEIRKNNITSFSNIFFIILPSFVEIGACFLKIWQFFRSLPLWRHHDVTDIEINLVPNGFGYFWAWIFIYQNI